MSALLSLRDVEGWVLGTVDGEDEPRVRDVDLGERLGYDRPRVIRELIERHADAKNLSNSDVRRTVRRTLVGVAERSVEEFWLSEPAALFIVAKSETPAGVSLTKEMIRIFMLARRGALQGPALTARAALGQELAAALAAGDVLEAGRIHGALRYLLPRATREPQPRWEAWQTPITTWLSSRPHGAFVTVGEVLAGALNIEATDQNCLTRCARCLMFAGWERRRRRVGVNGARVHVYQRACEASLSGSWTASPLDLTDEPVTRAQD